ncbi:homeobox-leucine zipper protein ROC1-like [Impatiens glandulifera]|uniref:homeobox-leucine zipper protein ROC1-like n=1 Tax=Impatiens glandulifera TaxID=253017 RepID=UPI001FB159B2|nr:homeobox-leucine zipper protein ROC1-like [Impatiens glandulifera]
MNINRHDNDNLQENNEELKVEQDINEEHMEENTMFNSNDACFDFVGHFSTPNDLSEMLSVDHNLQVHNSRLSEDFERGTNFISSDEVGAVRVPLLGQPIRMETRETGVVRAPLLGQPIGLETREVGIVRAPFLGQPFGMETREVGVVRVPLADDGSQLNMNMIKHMATLAIKELDQLAQMREPMWIPSVADSTGYELNEGEYYRVFASGFGTRISTLKSESSFHNHWKKIFNVIVSKAITFEVFPTRIEGSHDGALQAIYVDLHALSPLVPARSSILARHCKQLGVGRWGIVDFSIDIIVRPLNEVKYKRRPSGCIIEDFCNGFTKVTWIENVEVDESGFHTLYKPIVNSGLAFGAKRWLGILEKQINRLSIDHFKALPPNDMVVTSLERKHVITRLSERMVETFIIGVSSVVDHPWININLDSIVKPDGMRILMLRNTDNPDFPVGIVLAAAISFWLPGSPTNVFNFLRSKETRTNWDVLSNVANFEEISHIVVGQDKASYISLLQMSNDLLMLQEVNWDPLGAYLIYAPIDINSLNMALNGGNSKYVPMLSSGFAVVPFCGATDNIGSGGGSLVTVSFQFLPDIRPTAALDESYIKNAINLVNCTMDRIKTSLI